MHSYRYCQVGDGFKSWPNTAAWVITKDFKNGSYTVLCQLRGICTNVVRVEEKGPKRW